MGSLKCLICNDALADGSKGLQKDGDAPEKRGLTPHQHLMLKKVLSLPFGTCKAELINGPFCTTCFTNINNACHMMSAFENLQNSLEEFRNEFEAKLKASFEAPGTSRRDGTRSGGCTTTRRTVLDSLAKVPPVSSSAMNGSGSTMQLHDILREIDPSSNPQTTVDPELVLRKTYGDLPARRHSSRHNPAAVDADAVESPSVGSHAEGMTLEAESSQSRKKTNKKYLPTKPPARIKCDECGEGFPTQKGVNGHKSRKHKKSQLQKFRKSRSSRGYKLHSRNLNHGNHQSHLTSETPETHLERNEIGFGESENDRNLENFQDHVPMASNSSDYQMDVEEEETSGLGSENLQDFMTSGHLENPSTKLTGNQTTDCESEDSSFMMFEEFIMDYVKSESDGDESGEFDPPAPLIVNTNEEPFEPDLPNETEETIAGNDVERDEKPRSPPWWSEYRTPFSDVQSVNKFEKSGKKFMKSPQLEIATYSGQETREISTSALVELKVDPMDELTDPAEDSIESVLDLGRGNTLEPIKTEIDEDSEIMILEEIEPTVPLTLTQKGQVLDVKEAIGTSTTSMQPRESTVGASAKKSLNSASCIKQPQSGARGRKQQREWVCPDTRCGNNNFEWRIDCFQCGGPRGTAELFPSTQFDWRRLTEDRASSPLLLNKFSTS